jgi:hypothetical protein
MWNLPSGFQLEQLLNIIGPYSNFVFWIMVTPVVRLDVTAGVSIHKSHPMAFASFLSGNVFWYVSFIHEKEKKKLDLYD